MPIHLKRTSTVLRPDQTRVLLRPFDPGDSDRTCGIISRIKAIPEEQVGQLLNAVTAEFSQRHAAIQITFLRRYEQVCRQLLNVEEVSEQRKLLIGSYFLAEYSLESAALFNPSIVCHPDQTNVPSGALRFVLSLRATGEGHISSITFRTGLITADCRIEIDEPTGYLTEPHQSPNPIYEKPLFMQKLDELGLNTEFTRRVMQRLNESFTLGELRFSLTSEQFRWPEGNATAEQAAAQGVWLLAKSNHEVRFQSGQAFSDRILFPATPSQRNGIEDARFVCFHNGDNRPCTYYATFTAYDGKVVMPELVETADFLDFRFLTLNGPASENKGMALFPRKIDGRYAMLSRQGNEDISIMFSENVHFWSERKLLLTPVYPWEMIQIGNCGSPVETEAGWLVLSHGVGPMRKYCIGAFLLDLHDPAKLIGRLREPLISPNADEREGYVPNVVYSCGAIIHNAQLIIPYGLADHATGFATVPVAEVLAAME